MARPQRPRVGAPARRPRQQWLAQRRSALLRAFAVSQLCHGLWIALFYWRTPRHFGLNLFDVSGALTFPLLTLLIALTTPALAARIGDLAPKLQTGVLAYVWLQFFGFFIDRLSAGRPELVPWYWLAIALSAAAALLALWEQRAARICAPGATRSSSSGRDS